MSNKTFSSPGYSNLNVPLPQQEILANTKQQRHQNITQHAFEQNMSIEQARYADRMTRASRRQEHNYIKNLQQRDNYQSEKEKYA